MSKYFIGLAHFAIRSIYFHFINFQFITVRFKILRYSCVRACVCVCVCDCTSDVGSDGFCADLRHRPRFGLWRGYTVPESISGPIERSRSRLSVSRAGLERAQGERDWERSERDWKRPLPQVCAWRDNRNESAISSERPETRHSNKRHPNPVVARLAQGTHPNPNGTNRWRRFSQLTSGKRLILAPLPRTLARSTLHHVNAYSNASENLLHLSLSLIENSSWAWLPLAKSVLPQSNLCFK